jgi:hypothetical protein
MAEVFTNDPINWIKWGVVFAVLIVSFIISGKIIKKIGYVLQGQKKVDEAKKKGNVIKADRVSSRKEYESLEKRHSGKTKHFATYEYEVDGETCVYNGYFRHKLPPKTITLFYIDNPQKVFCMDDYQWNPFGGMVYMFFILIPFALAALTAWGLGVVSYEGKQTTHDERTEEILVSGGFYEGSITHNDITVNFKTPEIGTGGGDYDWYTYYTDEEEKTDVKIEFGFAEELPHLLDGSKRESCELWGKEMLYEISYIPFKDEYGDIREQEQLFAYWQLADDTFFMVVATGMDEELSNAYSQLINDEKFQNSFEISSFIEK